MQMMPNQGRALYKFEPVNKLVYIVADQLIRWVFAAHYARILLEK